MGLTELRGRRARRCEEGTEVRGKVRNVGRAKKWKLITHANTTQWWVTRYRKSEGEEKGGIGRR